MASRWLPAARYVVTFERLTALGSRLLFLTTIESLLSMAAVSRRGRLLGEGVVIVVSILMAFGIDALWTQRQSRIEEQEALSALESEFAANLAQVEEVLAGYLQGRRLIEVLVNIPAGDARALQQVERSRIMAATCPRGTFDPVLGTLEALISSGSLGVLRHAPLRGALTNFQNLVADAAEDAALVNANARDARNAEVALGGPWTDPEANVGRGGMTIETPDFIPRASAADIIRVREDAHFMGLAASCHIDAGYYVAELERLRAQILLVQDLITEAS
jgi:hypothetical protein